MAKPPGIFISGIGRTISPQGATFPTEDDMPSFDATDECRSAVEREESCRQQFPQGIAHARRQVIRQFMQAQLQEMFDRYRFEKITDRLISEISTDATRIITEYQRRGFVPSELPLACTMVKSNALGTVSVDLPMHLRLWLEAGEAMNHRRWEHDADCCTFLAHYRDHDLYHCLQGGLMPTVAARWSSDGPDYHSGIPIAQAYIHQGEVDHPLAVALQLAIEKGVTEARVTKREALLRDARAAGMEVVEKGSTADIIAKRNARTGRVLKGLRLFDNGTAVDMTVDLSVAKAIRGDRTIRKMLGL